MWHFLRGWRRTLGIIILLLACALTSLWIRSRIVLDYLEMPVGRHSTIFLLIHQTRLAVFSEFDPEISTSAASFKWVNRPTSQFSAEELAVFDLSGFYSDLKYRNHPPVVPSGPNQPIGVPSLDPNYRLNVLPVPYWLAIPLTVVAGVLLLSKTQKPSSQQTASPAQDRAVTAGESAGRPA